MVKIILSKGKKPKIILKSTKKVRQPPKKRGSKYA